jgi:leader peptidase (prepilin peptidase)/N-methyltransferase
LRWFHNIPVLSYVFLRGKCGFCGVKISARYPLVELLTASVWIACLMGFGELSNPSQLPIQPLVWSVLGSLYIAMVFIDFETMLLPDVLTLGALWVAMLGALLNLSGISIDQSIYGAMSGYLFMRVFIFAGDKFMGRPSMGLGDAKLVAALGALFGVTALPSILLMSSVTGIVIYCILMLRKSTEGEYIPFGPALIAGALAHAMGASHALHLI